MKRSYLLFAVLLMMGMLHSIGLAVMVQGRVYIDTNRNGRSDADEPGVAGVSVSDGLSVVSTDAAGTYCLQSSDLSLPVWICVPRDHTASKGFWRLAEGKGVENFGLLPYPQSDAFTFVQITDSHIGRGDLMKLLGTHLAELPEPFAFAINTGDLVGGVDVVMPEKAQLQYDRYLDALTAFKLPFFQLPGNHEHVSINKKEADKAHPFYGKGLYRKIFGPTHYSWDWAGVHLLALDGTSLPYQEKLGEEQLKWLADDLRLQPMDKPLILFCHQSLPQLRDAAALQEVLKGRTVLAGFCGHLHTTFTTKLGSIPVYHTGALSGAWWSGPNIDGTPQGFRLIQVKDGVLKTAYTGREGDHPISIVSPRAVEIQSGEMSVEVVIVDFGEKVEVKAEYEGLSFGLSQVSREKLWSTWKGTVDTRKAFDGARVLKVTARHGENTSDFAIRYLACNDRAEPYTAENSATVKLQTHGVHGAGEILLNGKLLGVIPAGTTGDQTHAFEVNRERLMKLNRLTLRAVSKSKDTLSVGPVLLEYKGKRLIDLRYPSFARHRIVGSDPTRAEKELYYGLP
ncbi:MAG: metallophosphoesterase [Kiritimatiellae bacterium]|jgi:hypothetical protein|nr:metallophosphoesterase [Kiritimatiellia bacterium]